jgi:hypothetical protein
LPRTLRGDVAPLIGATHLQRAAAPIEQLQEVIGLQDQVTELGVRDAVGALETPADRFLLQHVIDGEMLADITQVREQIDGAEPVGVVDDRRRVVGRAEIEEAFELRPHAGDIDTDLFGRQEIPLLRLAARIADHPGAAADERDRRVTELLEAGQAHHGEQVADVQARRRRVEADVGRDALRREGLAHALGHLRNHAAPLEFLEQRHCR